MPKKPNLLVLGASGGVANAFLHHLNAHRDLFGKLILLDKKKTVLNDRYIDHKQLRYTFIHQKIDLPKKEKEYRSLLKRYNINIVLDITDMPSLLILESTNKAGVSYINTALNDEEKTVYDLVQTIYPRKHKINGAPHILCTGMNPGAVNMWVRHGIEKYGVPKEITHFEYDTSMVAASWKPLSTWSIHEFLVETAYDPSAVALGRGKIKPLLPNAIERRESLKPILEPILKLPHYPEGFIVLHEENVTISYKYDVPSKFMYAIHPKTMREIIALYHKKKTISKNDLILGDNTTEVLDGADSIGVQLNYSDKKVYYFNSIPNIGIIGTNATYTQVIIGIFSALFTLLFEELKPAVYFVEDLYKTQYKNHLFNNMRVQEFVFLKKNGKLHCTKYTPMVKLKHKNNLPLYVM